MAKKINNDDLKEKLAKVIEDARKKQAETNEDGSKKYTVFEVLSSINVNDFISQNYQKLSYLSWSDALHIAKHLYPNMSYSIYEFETFIEDKNGNLHPTKLPYLYDPILGYLVKVTVTIEDKMETCMLPVFDSNHIAKKSVEYSNSKKKTTIEVANMGDINYAHLRALVKCLALHGLGDYIFRGESLPSGTAEVETEPLIGQYVHEEVLNLRQEIFTKAGKKVSNKFINLTEEQNKEFVLATPSEATKDQFNNGGDNREYVSSLISMASIIGIEISDYLKTIPQEGK